MADTFEVETFQHEELPDARTYIRLVEVISVDETREIKVHCKLTTWLKTTAPTYTAISYTWGDPGLLTVILVNGRRMEVRRNCENVLRHPFRIKGGYFWIDAICINQVDIDEKSFQVASMGEIFRDACQTLACVGDHDNDSKFLFKRLHKHQIWWRILGKDNLYAGRRRATSWQLFCRKSTIIELYNALAMFLQRPYFHRVWIFQELFFGQNVQVFCEDESLELVLLRGLFLSFSQWPVRSSVKYLWESAWDNYFLSNYHLRFYLEDGVLPTRRYFLWRMIDIAETLRCEDPRDRVFGTASMIDWGEKEPIRPNYGKDAFDLAVEVLERVGHSGADGGPDLTNMIALSLKLPDKTSNRLMDEILERQTNYLGPSSFGQTRRSIGVGMELGTFWGRRLYLDNGGWRIQTQHPQNTADCPDVMFQGIEDLRDGDIFKNIHKWSPGHDWDAMRMNIPLPQEAQPQDWLAISGDYKTTLALVAREISGNELRIVGKAAVLGWSGALQSVENMRAWEEAWQAGGLTCKVCLDFRDAIVLAYSCNWKEWKLSRPRDNASFKAEVDGYFETSLCGKNSYSYAIPMNS